MFLPMFLLMFPLMFLQLYQKNYLSFIIVYVCFSPFINTPYNIKITVFKMRQQQQPSSRRFKVLHTKFSNKQTISKLLNIVQLINWQGTLTQICQQLRQLAQMQLGANKYVWMVGSNPAYYIQYQIDSYAILKGRDRVILVWKPKFLQFPTVHKSVEFGDQPKIIKSMKINLVEAIGDQNHHFQNNITDFLVKYYGLKYFNYKQQQFETSLMTDIKNFVSRISKTSYWHCAIDDHQQIGITSRDGPYIKLRIRGVHEKYDKDIIIFSHQGKKQYFLRGKKIQLLSFLAMLLIFIAVISCNQTDTEGMCGYRNQMMVSGAAIMMGLMGVRVANRSQNKKKMQAKVKKIQTQE